jgi:thioredoxin 1
MNQIEFNQEISKNGRPVIVDFWATWCIPCKMTKPVLEKLAQEYTQKVDFLAINGDESPEVLKNFGVMGIPTVLAIREGKVIGRVTGAQNEAGYRTMFEALAEGKEVKIHLSSFDRLLRLGAGASLIIVGITTGAWFLAVIGGFVTFLGVYDRCPVWAAIDRLMR